METQSRTLIRRTDAARLAGVTTRTLKRWALAGRITEERDPLNGRPWYRVAELEAIRDNGQNRTRNSG